MPSSEPTPAPGFFARFFFLAWVAYFRTLFDAEFAAGVVRLRQGQPALPPPPEPKNASQETKKAEKKVLREISPDAALQILALLQREGRFIDFLEEDVAGFSDAQVGAAARVVHTGCRKALRDHVTLRPIRDEEEGQKVELGKGFDAKAIRLTGNVVGDAPYHGTLAHRGWRVEKIELPKTAEGHDPNVLAPAEVEL